jgi:hypothetical protein
MLGTEWVPLPWRELSARKDRSMIPQTGVLLRAIVMFATLSPIALPQSDPVTFSVNGPVDPQTEGLRRDRGAMTPVGTFSFLRTPTVPRAVGLGTFRPGDVNDYWTALMPSEAELFQSEPDPPMAAPPSGTNNQILVASEIGLVAGTPFTVYRDNVNGVSFGEDFFGVTAASGWIATNATTPWNQRTNTFAEPTITGDSGTSFRLSVDPWSVGLPPTALRGQAGAADIGTGLGPWMSPMPAAGDIFATPLLTRPGAPFLGMNYLIFDHPLLGLSTTPGVEDDLDALECVGDNDPYSWTNFTGSSQPGNLIGRLLPLAGVGALGAPGVSTYTFQDWPPAPVFFTVDRNSRGAARSAVRTQAMWMGVPEAAGDIYMAFSSSNTAGACFGAGCGTNYLLLDESELGLFAGAAGIPTDDMDALILWIHPDDRYDLIELVKYHMPTPYNPNPLTPSPPVTVGNPMAPPADQYLLGPGYSMSLLRFFYNETGQVLRIRVGFSVTTDSIGAQNTAVDYEAGLKPTMQQAGDIFYTHFGDLGTAMGVINPEPFASGTNFLWYQETELGLDPGSWSWINGVPPTDLAALPDELNALDSIDSFPVINDYCATAITISEGTVYAGSNVGATTGPDPAGTCGSMLNDVWYTFTASCGGPYRATTCVAGTNYDTVVAVFTGPCGALTQIACNDDSCVLAGQFLSSTATFTAVAGTTYYVSVGGYTGLTGSFSLSVGPAGGMTLAFTTSGPGTLGYTITGGPSSGSAFTPMTLLPGAYPSGWLFGLDITLIDALNQYATGSPFITPLNACGGASVGPFPNLPSGLTIYAVSMGWVGPNASPTVNSAPASGTIP